MQNQGEEQVKKEVEWDDLPKEKKMLIDRNWINKLNFIFHAMFESATYAELKGGTKRRKWAYYFKKCTHKENSKDLRKTLVKQLFRQVVLCKGGSHYFRDEYGIENDKLPDAFNNEKNMKEAKTICQQWKSPHYEMHLSTIISDYAQVVRHDYKETTYLEKRVLCGQWSEEERRERCIQKYKEHVAQNRNLAEELKQIQALGEGITIEKLPVYVDDFPYWKSDNPYTYNMSSQRLDRHPEVTYSNSMNYFGPKDQEQINAWVKQKRQREDWIIQYEEQPVIEPEMQQLIKQWRAQKFEFMRKVRDLMQPTLAKRRKELEALLKQIEFKRRMDDHKLSVVRSKQYFEKDPEKKKAYQPDIQLHFKIYKETQAQQRKLRREHDEVCDEHFNLGHGCQRRIYAWDSL